MAFLRKENYKKKKYCFLKPIFLKTILKLKFVLKTYLKLSIVEKNYFAEKLVNCNFKTLLTNIIQH